MIISLIKNIIHRRETKISPFAILTDTEIARNVGIRPLVKMERCRIGRCSYMGTMSAAYDTIIGNFCSIARECYIGGATHPLDRVSTSVCFYLESNYTGICYDSNDFDWHTHTTIGNDVWLGTRVTVLGGVTIADGAVIGAGSVVTKDVGPYEIWAGNPARFIRKRFDESTIQSLLKMKWWYWDDSVLKEKGYLFTNVESFFSDVSTSKQE